MFCSQTVLGMRFLGYFSVIFALAKKDTVLTGTF
jgi:hypothetical protein